MTASKLVTLSDPRSAAAEAFRTLRTNLIFSGVERAVDTILVTSAAQSEDKSIALANLAVTFAQAGNKTIIVDADLRRPAQHDIWGVGNERGLTTMIIDAKAVSEPPLIATSVPDLLLLPSGPLPPIPADILSSQRLVEIIGVLKARAHYILFDSPPVLAASDAALLGAKVDGVVLAMRAGTTRRDHAARAREALERVHVRLLGAVLTNAPREDGGAYV
ncbi:MAG: CpsD/CapB family tyrosine-protein kinase [Anaerolineae bacterium]|nr:CpsD/CapB family tyrosine-protein kinase [Anaerolineae bacterium]NUQ03275.1 CpsD/CapB family tyrosine-protein kinase [Anaerolineae bacterium]